MLPVESGEVPHIQAATFVFDFTCISRTTTTVPLCPAPTSLIFSSYRPNVFLSLPSPDLASLSSSLEPNLPLLPLSFSRPDLTNPVSIPRSNDGASPSHHTSSPPVLLTPSPLRPRNGPPSAMSVSCSSPSRTSRSTRTSSPRPGAINTVHCEVPGL